MMKLAVTTTAIAFGMMAVTTDALARGGDTDAQRKALKAEWAKSRADRASDDKKMIERAKSTGFFGSLFGSDDKAMEPPARQ